MFLFSLTPFICIFIFLFIFLVVTIISVTKTDAGLHALIFTAEGDMRNALNNLQSTHAGFGTVNDDNVYKVCDQPHPLVVEQILVGCQSGDVVTANQNLTQLWNDGYSAIDIIGVFFRIVKKAENINELLQLQYIRLIGFTHMRIADGLDTLLQLQGLVARMCAAATLSLQGTKGSAIKVA